MSGPSKLSKPMLTRPFIYFSEAILTPNKHLAIIANAARRLGAKPRFDLPTLWTEVALSVQSQASLYRSEGYKGEKFHNWLHSCVDTVAANYEFPTQSYAELFRHDLLAKLYRPESYYVPKDVQHLIADLKANKINWGVIANDSHRYLSVLHHLGLQPSGPIIQADGANSFKPMPSIWQRAVNKAPKANVHNLWFIGSQASPCDNMTVNPQMVCALVASNLVEADHISHHFRVSCVDDLRPFWMHKAVLPLDLQERVPQKTEEDVSFTQYRPRLPPRSVQELSLSELKIR